MNPSVRERLQRAAVYFGYGAFFFAALLAALVLTFPTRQLQAYVEAQSRKAGMPLTIGEMSLRGIGGVTMEEVALHLPAKPGPEDQPGRPAIDLKFDRVRLDVAVWRALWRRELAIGVDVEAGEGSLADGLVVVRPLSGAAAGREDDKPKERGDKAGGDAKGEAAEDAKADASKGAGRRGYAIDLDLPTIERLPLESTGLGALMIAVQSKVQGTLDGELSGSVQLHWGGTFEDATGKLNLTITDSVLRKPAIDLGKMGNFQLADLRMGNTALKITMAPKGEIAVLSGARGSDKSTAIAFENIEVNGRDIELLVEERSHALVPPGPAGVRMANLQLHFAFRLPDAAEAEGGKDADKGEAKDADKDSGKGRAAARGKSGDPGGKDGKGRDKGDAEGGEGDAADDQRAKWSSLMEIAGSKLKPFTRNGYVGMTCTGLLLRPSCNPDMPRVTVGTRGGAGGLPSVDAAPGPGGTDEAGRNGAAAAGTDAPAVVPPVAAPPTFPAPGTPNPERVELKPAMADAPLVPRPAPALAVPSEPAPAEPAEQAEEPPTPSRRGRGVPQPSDQEQGEGEEAPRDPQADEGEPREREPEGGGEAEESGGEAPQRP